MRKKIIITETQIENLLNRMSNESNEMNEALGDANTNARPSAQSAKFKTIELGNNLFKLGSDKINTNSDEFKRAKELISKSKSNEIRLQGGASSVGGPNYDNQGLANRRAENFKRALINAGVNIPMTISQGVVTPNTNTPNSPEANKAQFVRFTINQSNITDTRAIDNTAVQNPRITGINAIKPNNVGYIDVRVFFTRDKSLNILNLITSALKSVAVRVDKI